mmetsp:Transcript_1860/g.2866  ORF Transcript_1860/g.2866 Transcript_1860/m.2866 type:complete len:80 (+) Transcript_1860:40-279(+)
MVCREFCFLFCGSSLKRFFLERSKKNIVYIQKIYAFRDTHTMMIRKMCNIYLCLTCMNNCKNEIVRRNFFSQEKESLKL